MHPLDLLSRTFRVLPVVERELRQASRGSVAHRWRTRVVGIGLGLLAVLTASLAGGRAPASEMGRVMFLWLVALAGLYAFLAGVTVSADAVSREKREGTLGLLFLTDLRGVHVVFGKLAASSLNTVYGLLGLAPLLAIPVMLGGVSIQSGVTASIGVLNLLFVSLATGIAVSSVSWDERRAMFGSILAGVSLLLGPALVFWMSSGPAESWFAALLVFSPALPVGGALVPPDILGAVRGTLGRLLGTPVSLAAFMALITLPSHLLGWCLLFAAGRAAGGSWQSRRGTPVRRTIDERVFNSRRPEQRTASRRRLLEVHPLVWLLERHPGKRFYADGLAVAILIIWVTGFRSYGTDMFGGPTWFLIVPIAVIVHLVFVAWVVAEVSLRWIEDRRSGALELLLCTGLSDREFVGGYRLMLRRLFSRAILLLAAAEVFAALNGFDDFSDAGSRSGRAMLLSMAAALVLDTWGLSWIGLRLAASLPTVNRVEALALLVTPCGPIALTVLTVTLWNLTFGITSPIEFTRGLAIWVGWVAVINLGVGLIGCRGWILRNLRATAARLQAKAEIAQ